MISYKSCDCHLAGGCLLLALMKLAASVGGAHVIANYTWLVANSQQGAQFFQQPQEGAWERILPQSRLQMCPLPWLTPALLPLGDTLSTRPR